MESGGNDDEQDLGLNSKQKKFIKLWYNDFAKSGSQSYFSGETMSALAVLIQVHPQLISEYIKNTYTSIDTRSSAEASQHNDGKTPEDRLNRPLSSDELDNLASMNTHLPLATLSYVSKYIATSRRPRSLTDGRRSVNTGPYRCTFGCGYRTKRAFDWRRHEETHEPQELYLCTLCQQNDKKEPFLVSRKDKFLKHARELHKDWVAERVLDLSKVDYQPSAELACPICGWRAYEGKESWDERCRHVLSHFEDEIEQELKRRKPLVKEETGRKRSAGRKGASTRVTSDERTDDVDVALSDRDDRYRGGIDGS